MVYLMQVELNTNTLEEYIWLDNLQKDIVLCLEHGILQLLMEEQYN